MGAVFTGCAFSLLVNTLAANLAFLMAHARALASSGSRVD
jgi:hypothetical protein